MGCFWGAERIFWQLPGVYTTAVGYMGGWTKHPTYEETCTAQTGHTETVLVVYDPEQVSVDQLMKAFWENHDPTTPNRQGNDVGTQYRSAVFATTPEQLAAVEASRGRATRAALTDAGYGEITTQIALRSTPATASSTTPRSTTRATCTSIPAVTATTGSARSATTSNNTAKVPPVRP